MGSSEAPNFCLPIKALESARVKLTPYIPSQHAQAFFDASHPHPDLYRYINAGPFSHLSDYLKWYNSQIHPDPTIVFFAIFDKTRPPPAQGDDQSGPPFPGALAGTIGLLNASPAHASLEIGYITILPEFQRTHVNTNAVGLLLHYCLDLPSQGGLGLRRVQWQTNAKNLRSVRAAERMGFAKEGIIRWHRVLLPDKEGNKARIEDPIQDPGRDTALLSICWDDWETLHDKVDALMHRVIL